MTVSSYCVGGDCLIVEYTGTSVIVQDSKRLGVDGGPVQVWLPGEWDDLLRSIREYRVLGEALDWVPTAEYPFAFGLARHEPIPLTDQEWYDLVAGVLAGEFEIDKLSSPAAGGLSVAGRTVSPDVTVGSDQVAATGAGETTALVSPGLVPVAASSEPAVPTLGGWHAVEAALDGLRRAVQPVYDPTDPVQVEAWQLFMEEQHVAETVVDRVVTAKSGPNVASPYVPAGRGLRDESTPVGSLDAVATTGQPGPRLTVLERVAAVVEQHVVRIGGRPREVVEAIVEDLASGGLLAEDPVVDVDELLARGAAPLVPIADDRAVADGWAPGRLPDGLVVDCDCLSCRSLRDEAASPLVPVDGAR